MPGLIAHIRQSASRMAFNSLLYDWSLRGAVPERMVVRPVDPWAGRVQAGKALCTGELPEGCHGDMLHNFVWLRDLRALAQEKGCARMARAQARFMIQSWIENHGRWQPGAWDAGILGERIAMWISNYEFFMQEVYTGEEEPFQDLFFESLSRQSCHLSRLLGTAREGAPAVKPGIGVFRALKGLLYAGLAFEGRESWIEQALSHMEPQLTAQIATDGSHVSRSPAQLLDVLQILLDVRMALNIGDYPVPESLQEVLESMTQALHFFRYPDKALAVLNGGQESNPEHIEAVLAQTGLRNRRLKSLPEAGFEKAALGRSTLLFDSGAMPSAPYDDGAHAAPLSFEMICGKERLLVNCGSHASDPAWREILRATAAHTGLTLDSRNAWEIAPGGGGFLRRVRAASVRREDEKDRITLEAAHDGYKSVNGFTHQRRLTLLNDGRILCGQDTLCAEQPPARPVEIVLRFHLHPRVMVSLIREGQEALMRLPGGTGWRFEFSGGRLALEDSIYVGEENRAPCRTKQLVIYAGTAAKQHRLLWKLQKEG